MRLDRFAFFGVAIFFLCTFITIKSLSAQQNSAPKSNCERFDEGQSPFRIESGIVISKESSCSIGPTDISCSPLKFKGKEVVCMVRLTVTSAGVFGIPCERGVLEFGYDKLHDQFSKAVWDGKIKAMKFEAISAPGLTKFSNPSACKSYLAYWGMNESKGKSGNEIKAVVFDLNGGKANNQEDLGYSDFATDNLGYFKTPRWAEEVQNSLSSTLHLPRPSLKRPLSGPDKHSSGCL